VSAAGGAPHSAVFTFSSDRWRALRDEYEDRLLAAYSRAEIACNGKMLNARGQRAEIDAVSLFMGQQARALAYASPELIDHWRQYPRVTFQQFERERSAGVHHDG
jgi:hypothetical protein